jgi:hypothetical protein
MNVYDVRMQMAEKGSKTIDNARDDNAPAASQRGFLFNNFSFVIARLEFAFLLCCVTSFNAQRR